MKILAKYWKVLLSVVLLLVAAWFFSTYRTEKAAFEAKEKNLNMSITALNNNIEENLRYTDIVDELPEAVAELEASRLELYQHFPVELKEEDQIMYVLYLESLFGTEISFSFGEEQPMLVLSDGSTLVGLTLTVNYEATYQGFKDMVSYISTDSRITSVQYASMEYDPRTNKATGEVTLLLYVMKSDLLEYLPPAVLEPDTGKDNIFE